MKIESLKKERWRTWVFLFLLFACVTSFAKQPIPKGLKIDRSSNGYVINFELPQYKLIDETGDNEHFAKIAIDGYGENTDEGLPSLPQCSFNLIIADSKSLPSITVDQMKTRKDVLSKHIYPVQKPFPKSKPFSERPFTINKDYYKSEGKKSQAMYSISEPFEIAGVVGVTITIYPFKYNPSKKSLEVIEKMTMKVESKYTKASLSTEAAFNDIYNTSFVNSSDFISAATDSKASENYLIITAPAFESTLSRFVEYRQRKGMNVNVFSTDETGTSNTQIKSFIQSRYDNISTRPSYILLVGDVDQIPAWTSTNEDNPYNDLYYSTLAGTDYFPDALLGRFSVSSTTELTNIITKTIYMDSVINDVTKKAVFLASRDNYTVSEGTHNYAITNYFSPKGYTCTKRYCVSTSATTAQVLSDLNLNQTFCIYSGHGAETYWADGPVVHQSDVRSLTNSNIYPFVYAFTCLSGAYANTPECFAETWIRTSTGGSSYWGSSVTSYWTEDDILEKETFKAVYQDSINGLSASFNQGKIALYNYYSGGGRTHRYFEQYNLFGDPALPVYMSWDQGVNLQYSSSITTETRGNNDGIVNPGESADLSVSLKNTGTSDANQVSAQLTTNDPYVTITNGMSAFGTIAARGTIVQAQQPFAITVSSDCPTPRTVTFGLTSRDENNESWASEFTITINTSSRIGGFVHTRSEDIPLANATVICTGPTTDTVLTDVNGQFIFNVIDGNYTVSASAQGYSMQTAQQITTPPSATNILFLLGRPEIHVTPARIEETLPVNRTKTSTLTINNTGYEPLQYSLSQTFKGSTVAAESLYNESHFTALSKESADNRIGLPVSKATGGPDSYGYRWIDSDAPNGPAYVWDDISTSGQRLSLYDESTIKVPLYFSFKFYGTRYDSIYVCSNGFVSFGNSSTEYINYAIPYSSTPNNFAAAFWDDLNPGAGGSVYYKYYSDRAVVQFQDVPHYSSSGTGTYTFQIVLYASGRIMYYYKSMVGTLNSATTGIENVDGTIGLPVAYNTSFIHNQMAIKISDSPEWITVSPISGSIEARSSLTLQVQLSSNNLIPGVYESTLSIQHNDPSTALPVSVPVKMTVTQQDILTLLPLTAGTSTIPADRSGQLILENITAGSAASGPAIGTNFRLYLH